LFQSWPPPSFSAKIAHSKMGDTLTWCWKGKFVGGGVLFAITAVVFEKIHVEKTVGGEGLKRTVIWL